eukprot:TRINITY_DN19951_c0_g1_i1.p2 TRINITY_DN19951_c0_g1~~TRINITY_DN19951_c0_g1_i1.p2  ORF type:complete len:392 (+),score=87.06 TRINITY_DN19951_c0_g1_i1:69-1244(+)
MSTSATSSESHGPSEDPNAAALEHLNSDMHEEDQLDSEPKSLLLSIISQLSVGMDLSRVTLPTFVLEPRSLLEKLSDFMSHGSLYAQMSDPEDPLERFLAVLKWYVSGWHMRPQGVKKPYNPIIGEIFRCKWDHGEEGVTHYLAEQVSHHPPISAYAFVNRKKQIFVHGSIHPKSRYLGNSAASLMEGQGTLLLLRRGEKYTFNFPDYYARGILIGTLLMETVGSVKIECESTGYSAELEFKAKGYFRGDYNEIGGTVKDRYGNTLYTIGGKWDSKITITDECNSTNTFFSTEFPRLKKTLPPYPEQDAYESRKLWEKVTTAILGKDLNSATDAKSFLEQRQRDEAKERKEKGQEWKTIHFHLVDDQWRYKSVPTGPFSPEEISEDKELLS